MAPLQGSWHPAARRMTERSSPVPPQRLRSLREGAGAQRLRENAGADAVISQMYKDLLPPPLTEFPRKVKTMNQIRFTLRFRLDHRRCKRKGCDMKKLRVLLELLRLGAPLPLDSRNASVKGTKARACRIEPGWMLVYQTKEGMVTLLRMKYIPRKRPKAAPPLGLWFKTLFRSPVKTVLTVLLLAAAAFLLLDNLSSYAMQTEAV